MLTVPATVSNARVVRQLSIKHNLSYDTRLDEILESIPRVSSIPGFNFALKSFQAEGVAWLEKVGGRGLLADEMGTGKTVQLMAYAHKNQMFPMLVVVPNSIKLNWRNEILAMTGSQYRVNIVGTNYSQAETRRRAKSHPTVIYSKKPTVGCDIYVINYDIVANNVEALEAMQFKFMAVDESHKVKNSRARRTEAVVRLSTGLAHRKVGGRYQSYRVGPGISSTVFASGTPQVNRPVELWTSVNTLAPWVPEFNRFMGFATKFCGAQQGQWGWDFTGSSNTAELNQLLTQHVMLRRLKKDVLKELPGKVYTTVPLEFDRREYNRVAAAFEGTVDWKKGMATLVEYGGNPPQSSAAIVEIQKLREIAGYAKLRAAAEWIQDFTDGGEKLVVFAHHRNVLDQIKAALEKNEDYAGRVGMIMGGISNDERNAAVERFQADPEVRVMLVGITSGGFGLTLTAARAVAFVQTTFSPADYDQAVDRVHRVGQTADSVQVFDLVAEGTIEEDLVEMIHSKRAVIDAVIDGI